MCVCVFVCFVVGPCKPYLVPRYNPQQQPQQQRPPFLHARRALHSGATTGSRWALAHRPSLNPIRTASEGERAASELARPSKRGVWTEFSKCVIRAWFHRAEEILETIPIPFEQFKHFVACEPAKKPEREEFSGAPNRNLFAGVVCVDRNCVIFPIQY